MQCIHSAQHTQCMQCLFCFLLRSFLSAIMMMMDDDDDDDDDVDDDDGDDDDDG